jgi:hypothetical protein
MLGRVGALLRYKLLFFFGPSLRGKWGPAPLIALELLFALYGFGAGIGIGLAIKSGSNLFGINVLGTVFASGLSFAFLWALGPGVTAHASELDFVLTSQMRPREYLVSDMLFQFGSISIAGGLTGIMAMVGLVYGLGRPFYLIGELLLLAAAFIWFVLVVIQIIVVLKIRYEKRPVRSIVVVLLVLSLLPAASLLNPSFPLHFNGLPLPQTGFADISNAILQGTVPSALSFVYAFGWLAVLALVWYAVSDIYVFHGIRPSLSAGLGQVDISQRMLRQRRITGALGGLTTRISLRTDTGTDLGFMTRFHLIRVWRDGSILFVLLIMLVTVVAYSGSPPSNSATSASSSFQILTIPIAIFALNWSYNERENLWTAVTAGRSVVNYFKGLMLAMATLVIVVAGTLAVVLDYAKFGTLNVKDVIVPIISPLFASMTATAILTRVKILPGAFSSAILLILLVTVAVGFGGGYLVLALVSASGPAPAAMLAETVGAAVVIGYLAEAMVGKLAEGFRL